MSQLQKWKIYFLALILIFGESVVACPALLENMKTQFLGTSNFCKVYDRFHEAKTVLKQKANLNFDRISDYIGPQFINGPDWAHHRFSAKFNPYVVYDPTPETWMSWEKGQAFMELTKPKLNDSLHEFPLVTISEEWILKMHELMMEKLMTNPGQIRKQDEVGLFIYRKKAASKEQIRSLKSGAGYKSYLNPSKSLFVWNPTICYDQQISGILDKIEARIKNKEPWFFRNEWAEVNESKFFKNERNEDSQCGYVDYPSALDVQKSFEMWLAELNQSVLKWRQEGQISEDFLLTMARIQRQFIGVHPFADGNGRVSRNIILFYIQSLGLPAPILANMDEDMYLSESEWAEAIGKGILRSLYILERCAQDPTTLGCNVVPRPEKKGDDNET